ncbi:hypothetical protein EUGRSUZ_H00476 [Eucalyptus grandis]|uniref:Uncharacterized protein n=2 Tax=Eucalyptus grandis TaxID=71139 RepID=A0ACC3JKM3_EUCGR|nr:hypothetical protein EUGRSUZ_H00476 [Eucalyptus grandis]
MRDPYSDFDGDASVDTVLVVEVDAIDVETLQAVLAGRPHVHLIAPDIPLSICIAEPELGRQFHLLSHPSLQILEFGMTVAYLHHAEAETKLYNTHEHRNRSDYRIICDDCQLVDLTRRNL